MGVGVMGVAASATCVCAADAAACYACMLPDTGERGARRARADAPARLIIRRR
eukprot:SAG31_NODE_813_length_11892_cov_5.354538_6_plen_53_part_00